MQFKTYVLVFLAMITLMAKSQLALRFTRVRGTVYCTADSNFDATSTPSFPFAKVELRCVLGELPFDGRTNADGIFTIVSSLSAQFPVSFFLNSCHLKVPTDLSKCDESLPSDGDLISSLQYIGDTIEQPGNYSFSDFIPTGFRYLPETESVLHK